MTHSLSSIPWPAAIMLFVASYLAAAQDSGGPPSTKASATRSATRPDLDRLSLGLPPGWRAMWDKGSGDIYYGNLVTKVKPLAGQGRRTISLRVASVLVFLHFVQALGLSVFVCSFEGIGSMSGARDLIHTEAPGVSACAEGAPLEVPPASKCLACLS